MPAERDRSVELLTYSTVTQLAGGGGVHVYTYELRVVRVIVQACRVRTEQPRRLAHRVRPQRRVAHLQLCDATSGWGWGACDTYEVRVVAQARRVRAALYAERDRSVELLTYSSVTQLAGGGGVRVIRTRCAWCEWSRRRAASAPSSCATLPAERDRSVELLTYSFVTQLAGGGGVRVYTYEVRVVRVVAQARRVRAEQPRRLARRARPQRRRALALPHARTLPHSHTNTALHSASTLTQQTFRSTRIFICVCLKFIVRIKYNDYKS
ncbi:unnamed protein product [Parnassius apollo]|uniref:(apollo) hypothetical protein n=1 Tax=Parnassius apollo TaxID=110799 RepID=A0A8S3WI52_PARAO|nr:unnamed protein product [Parnassius apollo]